MGRPPIELPPQVLEQARQLRRSGSSVAAIRAVIFRDHGLLCSPEWWRRELPKRPVKRPFRTLKSEEKDSPRKDGIVAAL